MLEGPAISGLSNKVRVEFNSTSELDHDDTKNQQAKFFMRKFGNGRKPELSVGAVDLFNRINNARTLFADHWLSTAASACPGHYGCIRTVSLC